MPYLQTGDGVPLYYVDERPRTEAEKFNQELAAFAGELIPSL
jgi:hypothetical protein